MIGKRYGNYLVISELGRGGMGTVYLAENPSIGRRVAIKVLRDEVGLDPQITQRFLNEARAANAIHHPNIIEVVDAGTTEEGQPYLVMELLLGEELSRRIKRLRILPVQNALEITYQTASALGAAHKLGIIHRDLKPDNLFLVPDTLEPSIERVKVLDFGIAKLQSAVKQPMVKTQTGALMGTPIYMSPEQCLGTKEVDARSDIYSLGCILFEMLAGRPPFMSEGVGELIVMHINAKPKPIGELNPSVPQPIGNLIVRMLAKNVDERPQSMEQVQTALKSSAGSQIDLRVVSSHDLRKAATMGVNGDLPLAATQTAGSLSDFVTQDIYKRHTRKTKIVVGLGIAGAALIGALVVGGKSEPTPVAETIAKPETVIAQPELPKVESVAQVFPVVDAAPIQPAITTPEPTLPVIPKPSHKKPFNKKPAKPEPKPAVEEPAKL